MYNKQTAISTPRDVAVRHTLSRLRQRYGISATASDYDVLLGRVRSAVDQLSQGRNARHLKTNIVFDVEFPGPVVRVVYDRVEEQIKTALPLTEDSPFAELTTVNATSFISQFEADMSAPPPALSSGGKIPLSLMAALMSDISDLSIHQIQGDIRQVRDSLDALTDGMWRALSRSLEHQGIDIESWKPKSPEHRGLRCVIKACRDRLVQLEQAEKDFLERQAENNRYRSHLLASKKLAEDVLATGREKATQGVSFLRMPEDAEFCLYHVVLNGVPVGFCRKQEGQWSYSFYPEEGEKPKRIGRRPTRKEAAACLLDVRAKRLEMQTFVPEDPAPQKDDVSPNPDLREIKNSSRFWDKQRKKWAL